MDKPKHTPGPWTAVYRPSMNLAGVHIKASDTWLEVGYCNSSETETPEADARLIASAPELLEALNLILTDNRLMNAMSKQQARAVLDAVSKATGGAK